MKYYKIPYVTLVERFAKRHNVSKEDYELLLAAERDPKIATTLKLGMKHIYKDMPCVEFVKPMHFFVHIDTGCPSAPVTLLYQEFRTPHRCPVNVIMDVVSSMKRKHVNRGAYHHTLSIRIGRKFEDGAFQYLNLEVDLWQEIGKVREIVSQMAVDSTRLLRTKAYR